MNATNNCHLTAEQDSLNVFIQAENDAIAARCKAEGITFWTEFALTASDLAKYGVFNIRQFKEWREMIEAQEDEKEARKAYGY